jgi:hypothetical protein
MTTQSGWEDIAPNAYEIYSDSWATEDIAPRVKWRVLPALPRQRVFIAVLRATGLEDYEAPASSIIIRLRDTNGSYIGVTIPDPESYTDDILLRTSGRVHIFAGEIVGGVRQVEELMYGNIQNIYFNQGSNNVLTMAATRFITHRNPTAQTLSGVSKIRKSEDGRYSLRCAVDFFLKPTDTASYGSLSFVVDMISYVLTAQNAYMDVEGI